MKIPRGQCRLCGKLVRAFDHQTHERVCLRAIRETGREVCIPCATVFATPKLYLTHRRLSHGSA